MSNKRHFTIVQGNKEQGLFVSSTPSGAARKVVSKLSSGKKVKFYLREITQGSKKKVYGPYEGMKKKLSKPIKVGDRVYKYEPVVKKMKGGDGDEIVLKSNNKIAKISRRKSGFLGLGKTEYDIEISNDQGTIYKNASNAARNVNKAANRLRNNFPEVCTKKEELSKKGMFGNSWKNIREKVENRCNE